ncbi:MAG TPA: hypothetical protein PK727_01880 [Bacteroidales bacterium]|jgi:hypothetical protein|nr:hypothetical protein [Bacteroidales bacterium]HNY53501.1 hypothetical protein [Bacteroidales bacterium]HOG56058.1 hypothetical protein [Bacteroidales bacterium]
MKTTIKLSLTVLILTAFMSSCSDKTVERITYEANVPVYMSFNEFRTSFTKSDPIEISQPGKIYFKDNYLFVNETGKGIHVIDNSDPANPSKTAFYEILGNVDMAISGNILFADSYIDLVAIDISDIENPIEIDRIENIFPDIVPEGDKWYPYANVDKSQGVIVDWEIRTITEERELGRSWGGSLYTDNMTFTQAAEVGVKWSAGAGTAGSMARFMLNDHYLYLIAHPWMMKTVDIANAEKMSIVDSIDVSRNMETLFLLGEKLFVGTTTGMLIYDVSDATKPGLISHYDHITACDPVVADENYAYVTLRSGTRCANGRNLLEVIDISSIKNPYLVKSYPMYNPHGLGIDGDLLFICDGTAGLKIYDKSDPLEIINRKIAHYPDFNTYDVIPMNGTLMLVGEKGIYQYDYSNPQNIVELSRIQITGNEE